MRREVTRDFDFDFALRVAPFEGARRFTGEERVERAVSATMGLERGLRPAGDEGRRVERVFRGEAVEAMTLTDQWKRERSAGLRETDPAKA